MGKGGVDLEGLPGYPELLVLPEGPEGAHIVQPVRQLDEDNPDVLRHDDEHLAEVFRLIVLEGFEGELAELCHSVHKGRHIRSEGLFQLLKGDVRILEDVVKEGCHEGDHVKLHIRED